MRILLVEDDDALSAAVAETLADERYAVDRAATGAEADELMAVNAYDLAILDWTIPPPSGLELLTTWRRQGIATPVLMLTARAAVADKVSGLDAGADDFLAKPFALEELLARVRSLLRRREKPLPALTAGDLELDPRARTVRVGGQPVALTAKELGVLEYLLRHAGQVVSRSELSEHVWDQTFDAFSNTLDVIVYRVRKKVDGDRPDRLLHTVVGVGYMLSPERRTAAS